MQSEINELRSLWPSYLAGKKVNKEAEAYGLVDDVIPKELRGLIGQAENFLVVGSTGKGNVTAAPWIGIFHPNVTSTAQSGFYLVYLFSVDMRRLYLSLAVGVTQFTNYFGSKKIAYEKMRDATHLLEAEIPENVTFTKGKIDLAATSKNKLHKDYEHSNICAISYDLDNLPSDAQLKDDFRKMLEIYEQLALRRSMPSLDALIVDVDGVETNIPTPESVSTFQPSKREKKKRGKRISQLMEGSGVSLRRSQSSKAVGDRGELIVLEYERSRIEENLWSAEPKVRWLANEGQLPGYDILSCDKNGVLRHIEVKATKGKTFNTLVLTANELRAATELGSSYYIYLVYEAMSSKPKIEILRDPAELLRTGVIEAQTLSYLVAL